MKRFCCKWNSFSILSRYGPVLDNDQYHQKIVDAALLGADKQLKDILDELDQRKAFATKKEVLNMGMLQMIIPNFSGFFNRKTPFEQS